MQKKNEFVGRATAEDRAYGTEGKVIYVGDSVGQDTDTVELKATFPNPDGLLIPGQFVAGGLSDLEENKVLTVLRNAVQYCWFQ